MTVEALAERIAAEAAAHFAAERTPFVLLKVAASLDGRVATRTGQSQWITSPEARAAGRRLRAALPAILVGVETVLADDPQLTTRLDGLADPVPVVLDSRLRMPPRCALARPGTLVLTTRAATARRISALERAGVEVVRVRATRAGRVDLGAALGALAARDLGGVLVEGGPTVAGAFLDAGRVHRVAWFLAPTILGGDRSAHAGRGAATLDAAPRLRDVELLPVGPDWLLSGLTHIDAPWQPRRR